MHRKLRRAPWAPRLEDLESRTLLSVEASGAMFGPVSISSAAQTILVRFVPNTPASQIQSDLAAVGGRIIQSFPDGPSVVALAPWSSAAAALGRLSSDPGVLYADANAPLHAQEVSPSDPMFGRLWGLNNANNVDIDAPQAWSITTGNPSTIVAVLDTGLALNNAEFAGRIWTNPNPRGDSRYPGDLHGWNFVANSSNVSDNNGHGTHVAGVIAASANNGYGVAGINWQAQIMPLKVLDAHGNGSTDEAVSAIYFAVDHGARVINASWAGGDYSEALLDAIKYAGSKGVVFVVAAANYGLDNDQVPSYPSSYRLPNEIVVAAIDSSGNLASFSDYGAKTVDVGAPGVNIWSSIPGGFASYSGTSMATPYVSGVVSLLVGLHPGYSAAQLVQTVLAHTKTLPGLAGKTVTGGVIDAYLALGGPGAVPRTPPPASPTPTPPPSSSPPAPVTPPGARGRSRFLQWLHDHQRMRARPVRHAQAPPPRQRPALAPRPRWR
jgi:subtilisin family serine protease